MAIPNVNAITAQLRMMPDRELQQYAAMHKNDPYILPMAIAESNARKELRMQTQAKAAGQPQQKVADQAIAAMSPQPQPQMASQRLPEEQGIGALPVQNMQQMADGGIAGYADGGEFNYAGMSDGPLMHMAGGGEPVMRMAGGGEVPRFNGTQSQFVQDIMSLPERYTAYQQRIREEDAIKAQREKEMEQRQQDVLAARQKTSFANYVFGSPEREAQGKAELAQLATTPVVAPYKPTNPTLSPESSWPTSAASTTDTAKKPPAPPTARQPGAAPAASATPASSYEERMKSMVDANRPKEAQGITALLAEQKRARAEAGVTGEAGEAQKKAYEQEAETALGEKEQAKWMSVIKAGLSMMGGKSPHAMQNIAEGLGIGLDDYTKGLKEFKLAEKERSRGLAAIEEARRAEKRGDVDKAVAARDKADERMANYNMHAMQSYSSFFGNQMQAEASIKGHEISAAATRAAANRPPAELQLIERYGNDPKFAAAYDKYVMAKREPMTEASIKSDWAKSPYLQTQYPNVQDYLKMMSSSAGGASQLNSTDAALVNKYLR